MASVFHNSWWLDAATEENWQLLETDRRSGFVARLPIYKKRKYWQSVITMPPLTRTLGPTIHQIANTRKMPDPSERVRVSLIRDIVKKIPQDTIYRYSILTARTFTHFTSVVSACESRTHSGSSFRHREDMDQCVTRRGTSSAAPWRHRACISIQIHSGS
jgi:hypothetical protein